MKKITYLSIILLIAGTSCVKLKEDPKGIITPENFYKTSNDAVQAVTAVYFLLNSGGNTVQTPYNTLFSTGMDMMTDDIDPGPGATNPDVRSQAQLLHNSSGLRVLQLWQQLYAGVYKANVALDNIPGISMDANLKSRLLAESKFLRALYYFNLVRLYGDVPLILHATTSLTPAALNVARDPAAAVYTQIEQDLTEAADALPLSYSATDVGRATQGAAKALLSKVYLTEEKWQNAADKAAEVINGGYGYGLFANYSQVFLPVYKNGIEHIFSAQFKSNSQGQGNNQAPRGARKGVPGIPAGSYADQVRYYSVNVPNTANPDSVDPFFSIYKLYKPGDQRKYSGSFTTKFTGSDGKIYSDLQSYTKNGKTITIKGDSIPYLNKWWDPAQAANLTESAANVPIIRYSEVLLIYSEALNELGQTGSAYAPLNKVRNRAGLPDLTTGLDQNDFRDSLYLDRRLELVWENTRWFDLIREKDKNGNFILYNALQLVGKTAVQVPKHLLFPIPLQEIQLDPNLTQNPGW
jgi:hypothetical protein